MSPIHARPSWAAAVRSLLLALALSAALAPAASAREVVVVLTDGANPDAVIKATKIAPARVGDRYTEALSGFSADLTEAQISALDADARVVSVNPNVVLTRRSDLQNEPMQPSSQVVHNPLLRIGLPQSRSVRIDGRDEAIDVDIAVVDTGVDATHPDLRVVGGVDCSSQRVSPYRDTVGHGTMVAGLAAAKDNSFGVIGVAPGARIWSVKTDEPDGSLTLEGFMCSLEWLRRRSRTIEVANMSFGFAGTVDGPCGMVPRPSKHRVWRKWQVVDPYHRAICRVTNAGVTIAAAAGNEATDAGTSLPAAYPETIAVSALADHDGRPGGTATDDSCWAGELDDGLASFSNYGAVVDIAAPGICTVSTFPGNEYVMGDGTSFATPLVAGAAALIEARYRWSSPLLTRTVLLANAERWRMPNDPDGIAEPILSVRGL